MKKRAFSGLIGLSFLALATPLAPLGARDVPVAVAAPHERVLPLQGQNFRDLGGYPAADGRTVKWGLLFRSGSMHSLTPADYAYLQGRGIRTVCDFRSSDERKAEPVAWPTAKSTKVLADDYPMASLGVAGPAAGQTAEQARMQMAASYPKMLTFFNAQYRRMFAELLAGRAPLAFNCSAGKDRTGVAAALVLTALGVPRAEVIEDYLLTNRYFDPRKVVRGAGQASAGWEKLPPDVLKAYMTADRAYIESALKVIDAHPGGADGYLRDEMGLSRADLSALRNLYTERTKAV